MVRILWASPLPPVRSGVSDYAAELLAALAGRVELRLAVPGGDTEMSAWAAAAGYPVVGPEWAPSGDEQLVVHLGNNPYHAWLTELARRAAVVVLHDLVLHHLLVETTVARGDLEAYRRVLAAVHPEALPLAAAREHGIAGALDPFLFPALAWFLRGTRAVVVHSAWAEEQVARACPGLPVFRLAMPALDPGPVDRAAVRAELGLAAGDLALMHLGFLTRDKGLDLLLGALAAAVRCGAPARLVLVGEGGAGDQARRTAARLGLADRVSATGWVAADRLPRLPAAAELGVVLRARSAGETSAAVVRFLACGTPVAVMGRRQFLEWPPAAAWRVTPGPAAVADLTRVILAAADEIASGAAAARRAAARAAYEDGHRPEAVAARLLDILATVAGLA